MKKKRFAELENKSEVLNIYLRDKVNQSERVFS